MARLTEYEYFHGDKKIIMQYRVQSIIKETEDATSFVLEPLNQELKYEAGQFITLILTNRNNEEERRSYSISSAQALQEPLTITIKRVTNGTYSRKLLNTVRKGDILNGLTPMGFFTLPADKTKEQQFVFFAAGSGITPIYAQIKTLLQRSRDTRIVLVYSNRSVSDTLFYKELTTLAEKHKQQFEIRFLFSDASHYSHARLSASMVVDIVRKHFPDSFRETWFYLCGPFEYMLMITMVLRGMGIKDKQIRKEQFVLQKTEVRTKPADTNLYVVSAKLGRHQYSWTVQYPDTILGAAKKKGIELPYNCESGQCGACAAICEKGKVWMYKNDVLMNDEITAGRILTCTAYPIGGDVTIRY